MLNAKKIPLAAARRQTAADTASLECGEMSPLSRWRDISAHSKSKHRVEKFNHRFHGGTRMKCSISAIRKKSVVTPAPQINDFLPGAATAAPPISNLI